MAIKDRDMCDRIAGKLRAHRAEARLSQAQVAEVVDKDKVTIGRYEQGAARMDVVTAWELADLYGVSLDELVGRADHAQAG